jgi:hypothetical protein
VPKAPGHRPLARGVRSTWCPRLLEPLGALGHCLVALPRRTKLGVERARDAAASKAGVHGAFDDAARGVKVSFAELAALRGGSSICYRRPAPGKPPRPTKE